jgi:riboflavin kinase/FMN adenylyltransferase
LWQGQSYPSITNVGINPTVTSSSNLKIETHVLQKDINLYDQSVAVDLLHFLRDEKKFASIEELKIQIEKDIQQAQGFFYE